MANLFDKLVDGVNKGIDTVSTTSKTVVEKSNIKAKIKALETEKKQVYELIGEKVYTLISEGNLEIPDVLPLCEEIKKRSLIIDAEEIKLKKLETGNVTVGMQGNVKFCSQCGSQNTIDAKFCYKCGKQM